MGWGSKRLKTYDGKRPLMMIKDIPVAFKMGL